MTPRSGYPGEAAAVLSPNRVGLPAATAAGSWACLEAGPVLAAALALQVAVRGALLLSPSIPAVRREQPALAEPTIPVRAGRTSDER